MVDFLLGAAVASLVWFFVTQSRTLPGAHGLPATLLSGIEKLMSQVAEDIKAEIDAKIAAAVNAATSAANETNANLQAQLDTANADLADVKAHLDALPS